MVASPSQNRNLSHESGENCSIPSQIWSLSAWSAARWMADKRFSLCKASRPKSCLFTEAGKIQPQPMTELCFYASRRPEHLRQSMP
jgi:hypothetical protein